MAASLQPLLHDTLAVLRAPTQVWSAADGSMGSQPIHGIVFSDTRLVRALRVTVDDASPEHLATSGRTADRARIDSLLRLLDDPMPDPGVRLVTERVVDATGAGDTLTIVNRRPIPLHARIVVELEPDATSVDFIKIGRADAAADIDVEIGADGRMAHWSSGDASASLAVDGFSIEPVSGSSAIRLVADLSVPAASEASVAWHLTARDTAAVVRGAEGPAPWTRPVVRSADERLARWVERSLGDLDALRMTTVARPDAQFIAAGAPWFFTLFGRDSIWTARFLLPLGTTIARDTLRVLAGLQATDLDAATAAEPGKIMHELRRAAVDLGDGLGELPPLYYGTVDATALWILLLAEAWDWGMADDDVRALLPHLEAALGWMRDHGDADGDGLLEYIDRSGRGLANQGWKDSGDSVQWRDGRLAEGPIALCEVQGYAYAAAMRGAELLDAFATADPATPVVEERLEATRLETPPADPDRWSSSPRSGRIETPPAVGTAPPGALRLASLAQGPEEGEPARPGDPWRDWAARLRERFHATFWIDDPAGAYPAIALDANKQRVDTVTSNIGHLLGTGLLDTDQVDLVIRRLTDPSLDSGYGLRTMSTDAAGYWPLSYHGGSVWTHDTAIAILGMAREGRGADALGLIEGLLAAAEGFDFRMPELHSGDSAADVAAPVPYPAACRPQAWSAAASVAVLSSLLALEPAGEALRVSPVSAFGPIAVDGLRVAGEPVSVEVAGA